MGIPLPSVYSAMITKTVKRKWHNLEEKNKMKRYTIGIGAPKVKKYSFTPNNRYFNRNLGFPIIFYFYSQLHLTNRSLIVETLGTVLIFLNLFFYKYHIVDLKGRTTCPKA